MQILNQRSGTGADILHFSQLPGDVECWYVESTLSGKVVVHYSKIDPTLLRNEHFFLLNFSKKGIISRFQIKFHVNL